MINPEYYESSIFKKAFKDLTRGLEDHHFKHFNSSMGVYIYSKEHYIHELKKRGLVPFQEVERLAEEWDKKNPPKKYDDLSPKASEIIRSLKLTADKDGNIRLGNRAIQALIDIGAIKTRSEHVTENLKIEQ